MFIDFDQAGSLFWIPITFFVIGILIYFFSRNLFTKVSTAKAWVLITLRLAVGGLLLVILSEPVSQLVLERSESPNMAVLVDASASMGLSDRFGNRNEILANVFSSDWFNAISRNHSVHNYQFSENVTPLKPIDRDSLSTNGTSTNIGAALSFLKNDSRVNRLTAAILISDGNFTVGRDPLRVAEELGIPIYTVGIGDTLSVRDLSLPRLTANDIVYTGSKVPVEVTVRARGFDRVGVPVTLRKDGQILQSTEVILVGQGNEQTVVFYVIPDTAGLHRYQIDVPKLEGEITTKNNHRPFSIKVLESKLRVLYLEGAPRSEMGFLRRVLEKDANLEVNSLFLKPDGETFPTQMPSSRMEWFSYDLIILGSINYERLEPWVPLIVTFVEEKGGGLIALGGAHSFEMGGYGGTTLGNMIPFRIAESAKGMTNEAFSPSLTADGKVHPITKLDDDPIESERLWAELPPLPGMNQVGSAKPGAIVLATNPKLPTDTGDTPIIALHRYGQGKVLALAGHGFWQWDLMMFGKNGDNTAYGRLWNNAVRWLTVREGSRRIRVTSDKLNYRGGETIRFGGQIYDENYRPVDHATIAVTIRSKPNGDDEFPFELTSTGQGYGRYAGRLNFLSSGNYMFEAKAVVNGIPLGSDSGGFSVGQSGSEFEYTRMNRKLLAELAERTGGKFYFASEVNNIPEDLSLTDSIVHETHTVTLWNHPLMLVILISFIILEWMFRRYWGMV